MKERPAKKSFNRYPLAIMAASFALGIVFENWLELNILPVLFTTAVCLLLAFLLRHLLLSSVFIILAFTALGSFCFWAESKEIRSDRIRVLIDRGAIQNGDPIEIEGTVVEPPEYTPGTTVIVVEVDKITRHEETQVASGAVRLYLSISDEEALSEYEHLGLQYGSRISAACNISREEQYLNPGVISRIELLDREDLDAIANAKSPLLIERLVDNSVSEPLAWIYSIRQSMTDQFRSRFTISTAGVLSASFLGDKYFLDKPTADTFREGGTFHVLVISGLQITFIGGLLFLVVRIFTRRLVIQFISATAVLWAYTFAVGASVPVVRASLMFTILLFSKVIYRQGSLLNSLGACVIVLLTWRPSDLFGPSFQLTIISVAAIATMAFPLIEKLRAIGAWMPRASTPFPPNTSIWLVRFCEMLYWRPAAWGIETSRQIWSARIFKSPYLPLLALRGGQKTMALIFEGLLVSIAVQLWLLPFLIIYFHRIAPISIVMNLWVGIVMAAESFASLIGIILSQFSDFLAAPFLTLTEFFNYLLISIPEPIVRNQWASWRVPTYSGALRSIYPIYFIPVLILAIALWRWEPFEISNLKSQIKILGAQLRVGSVNVINTAAIIVLGSVIILHPFSAPRPDGRLHVDFLDVGQGDSALVTFPDGTTMLVDGGGKLEFRNSDDENSNEFIPDTQSIGEAVVSPVLWQKGYSKIDYILATHADADHIQGLNDVAVNFKIGKALFGRMPANDPEFRELASVLKRRSIESAYVYRGEILKFGGATVEVLYPRLDESADAPSDNNHSVVLRIVYGSRAFLLTGDIEHDTENELVNGGGILKADLIKVPHHGSRTSSTSEFINAVHPEYAIISVGRHSRFGHPHPEIVERWKSAGVEVMITGTKGMISVSTDGNDLSTKGFNDNGSK